MMTNFHASIRDLFEDVYRFLANTLEHDALCSSSLAHKDKLLHALNNLRDEYPELQLQFLTENSKRFSTASTVPYVDMNGGSVYRIPLFQTNMENESLDLCSPTDRLDSLECPSISGSEDYASDESKYLLDIAASDLQSCDKFGYLDKKRDSLKGWLNPFQKRWCAAKDGVLYYYEKPSDRKQKGCILLSGYEARALLDDCKEGKKHNHCFELVCPGKRTYQFSAASETDMQEWISAVENNNKITHGKFSRRESTNTSNRSYTSTLPLQHSTSNPTSTDCDYEMVDDVDQRATHESTMDKPAESRDPPQSNSIPKDIPNDIPKDIPNDIPKTAEDSLSQDQLFKYSDWYVGLWDCSATDDTELNFARGDLIRVVSKEYDSYAWWIGEVQGKVGFVPKSYLMEAYEIY